jgi:DNA-directed RNA polymerase subunit F
MDVKILERKPVSSSDAASILRTVKAGEKKPFQVRTFDTLQKFTKLTKADSAKMDGKLRELGIVRLADSHIADIISYLPLTKQELELILSGTKTTIKQEDQDKIISIVKEFA